MSVLVGQYKDPTYHERFGELFSCNKGVLPGLLRSPPSHWIQVKKTFAEINEGRPVVKF